MTAGKISYELPRTVSAYVGRDRSPKGTHQAAALRKDAQKQAQRAKQYSHYDAHRVLVKRRKFEKIITIRRENVESIKWL